MPRRKFLPRWAFITCYLIGTLCVIGWGSPVYGQQADILSLAEKVEPKVVELRGLPFLEEVEKAFQSPQELKQVLQHELERTYPGDALRNFEKRLLKFGFVVSPINLQQMMDRLLSQQIAGYYNPHAKKMVLIDTVITSYNLRTLSPLEYFSYLLIQEMGLSIEEVIFSHELTHVLQDQHFDLLSLPLEVLDPEDLASAFRALVEGDATIVMFDYLLAPQGADSTQVPELSERLHALTNSPFMRGFSVFQMVPKYLIENLLFSYTYGFDFVLQLKQRGGWKRVNQAYKDFPVSTEQILHPEKYLDDPDLPTTIQLPDLPETFSAWQKLEQNTLGEFNISILIDGFMPKQQAMLASEGWDGDRFVLYEQPETGQLLLAWFTTWDTPNDAREFFRVYTNVLKKRYPDNVDVSSNLENNSSVTADIWKTAQGNVSIELRGADVLILDGVPKDFQDNLRTLFWKSHKEPVDENAARFN